MEYIKRSDDQGDSSFDALDRLENLIQNEALITIFEKARLFEKELNSSPFTQVRANEIIQELDDEWMYMHHTFPVTGIARARSANYTQSSPEYSINRIEDKNMKSIGFILLPMMSLIDDEQITDYRIALCFEHEEVTVAMLEEDIYSELPDYSSEASEKRLMYHHSDEMKAVKAYLSRHDVNSSESALMRFKDYTLSIVNYERYDDEYITDLETYIYDSIDFDPDLPYLVEYNETELSTDAEPSYVKILARPDKLSLIPIDNSRGDSVRCFSIWVQLSVFSVNAHDSNQEITLPLQAIRQFESIRHLVNRQ